jgi:hypothetical protein
LDRQTISEDAEHGEKQSCKSPAGQPCAKHDHDE